MNNHQTRRFNGATLKRMLKISSLLIVAVAVTWSMLGQNLIADSLFQSPATSPVATPSPAPPPAATLAPAEVQSAPTATIVVEATGEIQGGAVPQPESEQPELTPTTAAIAPNPLAPTVLRPTEVAPASSTAPRPAIESSTPTGARVINEAKLIDTLITWTARSAMCLGGVVILLLLISLPLLYRRGKKLNQDNTD